MDYYAGEIRLFAGLEAPDDFMLCQGQTLLISSYNVLFAVIGTTYGGDGATNFKLPNLQGTVPLGMGAGPGLTARALGATVGEEKVTLTTAQILNHSHSIAASTQPATDTKFTGTNTYALPSTNTLCYVDKTPPSPYTVTSHTLSDATVGSAYGSQPHENRMPSVAINYIIAVNGLYPSRP